MPTWTPERIKNMRAGFNLSQKALGDLVGVSGNYIYMLEGGDRKPSRMLCLLLNRIEKELNGKGKGKGKGGKEDGKRDL
jgi:DNA-binding XRE family transcriptional regulator